MNELEAIIAEAHKLYGCGASVGFMRKCGPLWVCGRCALMLKMSDMLASYRATQVGEEWRDAVIDEVVTCGIYTKEHDTNPRKAIQDAITWNCQVALDPAVSSDARKLLDTHPSSPAGDWRPTNGRDEVDEARDHDFIWLAWKGGGVDLCEGFATIDWPGVSHWMPASREKPQPPGQEKAGD